jgi:2-aminoadipate transaminase
MRCLSALDKGFLDMRWLVNPEGGFLSGLKLEDFLSTKEILADAVSQGCGIYTRDWFYADGRGKNEARLAFCSESVENITKGISILSKIVKEKSRLYKSFK